MAPRRFPDSAAIGGGRGDRHGGGERRLAEGDPETARSAGASGGVQGLLGTLGGTKAAVVGITAVIGVGAVIGKQVFDDAPKTQARPRAGVSTPVVQTVAVQPCRVVQRGIVPDSVPPRSASVRLPTGMRLPQGAAVYGTEFNRYIIGKAGFFVLITEDNKIRQANLDRVTDRIADHVAAARR